MFRCFVGFEVLVSASQEDDIMERKKLLEDVGKDPSEDS